MIPWWGLSPTLHLQTWNLWTGMEILPAVGLWNWPKSSHFLLWDPGSNLLYPTRLNPPMHCLFYFLSRSLSLDKRNLYWEHKTGVYPAACPFIHSFIHPLTHLSNQYLLSTLCWTLDTFINHLPCARYCVKSVISVVSAKPHDTQYGPNSWNES